MRVALVVVLVAGVMAVPASAARPSEAGRELPKLSQSEAQRYMDTALAREFGAEYIHGYGHKVGCHKRLTRTKLKCGRLQWYIGDLAFGGVGRIWLSVGNNGNVIWNYAFRIKRFDEYCAATGGSDCVDTIRVE